MTLRAPVVCLLMMLVLALPGGAATAGSGAGHRIFDPDDEPFGQTYATIYADASKWLFEIPVRRNPLVHPRSPRNCEVHGDFVYVGVGTGGICGVPKDKAVLISFAGYECSTAEGNGRTFARLRRCAERKFHQTFKPANYQFTLTIDGERVGHPRRWAILAANRVVDFPKRNLFGATPGRSRSSTYGLAYVLKPMPEGRHVVRAYGNDAELGKFDIRYRFEVC